MAIYKQEILTKAPDTTNGASLPSVWKPVKDDGQTVVNKISFGLRATPNYSFKIGDAFEITVKTPVDITETELSIGIWVDVWSEGSEVNNIVASFPATDSEKVNIEEQKKILAKLKTASPTNPVRFVLVVTKPGWISNFAYANNWLLDDGLFIDFKKVKALHVDGKNMKEFTIDGHLYNFRQANLPADEQTPLQELIDSYDWTHMSYTGKTLLENSLTVNDLSGFPALHTGIVVTAIANGVSSGGQFVVNLEFSRTLSNGDVEKAVKYGNICTFIEIKAAPLAVWYGDSNGNVYKNGTKMYSHTGEWIKAILSKGTDVWYGTYSNKFFKNGTEVLNGLKDQMGETFHTFAIDKDDNIWTASYSNSGQSLWKNLTKKDHYAIGYATTSLAIDKDGYYYASSVRGGVTSDKPGFTAGSLSGSFDACFGLNIDANNNWYALSTNNYTPYKNGVEIKDIVLRGMDGGSVFINKKNDIFYYGSSHYYKQIYLFKNNVNLNLKVIDGEEPPAYGTSYNLSIFKNTLDSEKEDFYHTYDDKKIIKIEKNIDNTYKDPVVLYTTEGSNPVVCVNTELGGRTGNWEGAEAKPIPTFKEDEMDAILTAGSMIMISSQRPEFVQFVKDIVANPQTTPFIIELRDGSNKDLISENSQITLSLNDDSVTLNVASASGSWNLVGNHRYKFEWGKDPVDLGTY